MGVGPGHIGVSVVRPDAPRRWWTIVLAIAAAAFVVRLIYFVELQRTPAWSILLGDAEEYDAWARRIAAGDWFGSEVFYQTPLYPYLLAVIYKVVGHSLGAVRVIQALFGATSCVLLAVAGRQWLTPRVGMIAAGLLAVYPEAIFFDGLIQKPAVDLLLTCGLLAALGTFVSRPRRRFLIIAGLAIGAFVLNRENALVLLPVVIVWIALFFRRESRAKRATWAALVVAGAAAVVLPVGARNFAISGEFLISTSQFGPNFYIGNHAGASGGYESLIPGRGNAKFERADATDLAQRALGRRLSPGEVSAYWFDRALADIRRDPWSWIRLMGRKALLVINAREIVDTESMSEYAEFSTLLRIARVHSFGILLALAVAGAWITRARWRELGLLYAIVVAVLASVALFFVFSRYRYPVVPVLLLFEGAAISALLTAPFAWRAWRVPAALAAAVGVVSYLPLIAAGSETHFNIALQLSKLGRNAEAIPLLERALELIPGDPEVRLRLGALRLEMGDVNGAIADLQLAVTNAPDWAEAHDALGRALHAAGRRDEALSELATAVGMQPDAAPLRLSYGLLLWTADRKDEAIEQYRIAVRLRPDDPAGHNNLGLALHQTGRAAEAITSYQAALRLKADYAEAHSNFAALLMATGDLTGAREHFSKAVAIQPKSFFLHANFGDLLMKMSRPEEALVEYRLALANAPDSVPTTIGLLERESEALVALRRPAEARASLQRALQLAEAAGETAAAESLREALTKLTIRN